jgi:FdhD protein
MYRSREIWRLAGGPSIQRRRDELAEEEPLEIRVDGQPVSVTMRTPGQDRELAVGFLVSEGVIRGGACIRSLGAETERGDCNVVDVGLATNVVVDLSQLTRHVFASSSCGVCGKATIEAVHRNFPPIERELLLPASTIRQLPARLRAAQPAFDRTGGLHAAAVFDATGELVVLREDVGRHNAVDKVLGYAALNGELPLDQHVLLVSGRSSFEIVQKALAGRIPVIAAVSAASSLAVEFAERSRQTLIGFLRGEQMNVYSHPERIVLDR